MKIIDWFRNIFSRKSGVIDVSEYRHDTENQIAVQTFALSVVVGLIAEVVSGCEVKTYKNGAEYCGLEWYSLNVRPNVNQNAVDFWKEIVSRLLWYHEVLVIDVNGQKIIAEDFQKTEYALYGTKFSGVTRSGYTFRETFDISSVYYLNYSNFDVSAVLGSISGLYANLLKSAENKYVKSAGEKGILNISAVAQGSNKFEEQFKHLMTDYFKSYFGNTNAVLPLFDGYSYSKISDGAGGRSSEISDVKTLVDEAVSRTAQAFKVPSVLIGGNVAGTENAYELFLSDCIDPLCRMISQEFTGKQFTPQEAIDGCSLKFDTSTIRHADILTSATNTEKLISSGVVSPNEARKIFGIAPVREEWADRYYITKNFERSDNLG